MEPEKIRFGGQTFAIVKAAKWSDYTPQFDLLDSDGGTIFVLWKSYARNCLYLQKAAFEQAKFFGIIFGPKVNSHAGGMTVARPNGFEIDFVRKTISGSAAWFFVIILKFNFSSIFEIKIQERNPCHQKCACSTGPAFHRESFGRHRTACVDEASRDAKIIYNELEIENSGFLILGETHQYGIFVPNLLSQFPMSEYPSVPHRPPQFNISVPHKDHNFSAPEISQFHTKNPSVQHIPLSSTPKPPKFHTENPSVPPP